MTNTTQLTESEIAAVAELIRAYCRRVGITPREFLAYVQALRDAEGRS